MPRKSRCPHCQADLSEVAFLGALCPRCQLSLTTEQSEEIAPPATPRRVKSRGQRIALSKAEQETAIGIELLDLCQTITEDGRILDEEVSALRSWLEDNAHVDLPAIEALRLCVTEILADGVLRDDERLRLQKLIERVLPPDLRQYAILKRQEITQQEKAEAARQREEARQQAREQRELDRTIYSFNFLVAGVAYENRGYAVAKYAREGMTAYLIRDRANQYSAHAVEVRLRNGVQIGYVPEEVAAEIAPLLDSGSKVRASVKRLLTNTRRGYDIPVIEGQIYGEHARVPGAVTEAEMPTKMDPSKETGPGCMGCVVAVCLLLLLLLLVIRC